MQNTSVRLIDVVYNNDRLVLADQKGDPWVVMRPLVAAMGLNWAGQYQKIAEKFGAVVGEIQTTGGDGKQYSMICLPLRKLPAWLYSVNPEKLAPELREKVIRYQEECDEVLWRHWSGTYLPQNNMNPWQADPLGMGRRREISQLLEQISKAKTQGQALGLYDLYLQACAGMDVQPQALETLAPIMLGPDTGKDSMDVARFWAAFHHLDAIHAANGVRSTLNHSRTPGLIAVNLNEFCDLAAKLHVDTPKLPELKKALKESQSHRFLAVKSVSSAIRFRDGGKSDTPMTMHCWIFKKP
jgi:hypothetical protein